MFVTDLSNNPIIKTKASYEEIIKGDTLPFYFAEIDMDFNLIFQQRKNQGKLKFSLKNKRNISEYQFHKPIKTPKWSQDEVLKTLTKGAFTTNINKTKSPNSDLEIKKTLRFTEDSLTTHYAYYFENELLHQEQHTKSFSLTQKGNATFFSEKSEAPENPHTLYQISALGNDNFSLYYFNDQKEIIETYTLEEHSVLENTISYSKCSEMRPLEYYSGKFKYLKGNDYIIDKISKNAPKASGNGYINVHFIINCNNQIGMFGLEQMDRTYLSTSFEPALVKHIVQETLKLKDWPKKEYPRDIHAFLMFKIENGKITDLCP